MLSWRFIADRRRTSPIWLTVYSDLMTNLMLFFLMLFGYTQMGGNIQNLAFKSIMQHFSGEKKKISFQEKKVSQYLVTYFGRKKMEKFAGVKVDEEKVEIMLRQPVLFDTGKAELKSKARMVLHDIAKLLKDLPNTIVVEGYTDNIPIIGGKRFSSNWELSAARALAVVKYFIDYENIPPYRLSAIGYGEHRPIVPNDTDEHRALNRRVKITIIRMS